MTIIESLEALPCSTFLRRLNG